MNKLKNILLATDFSEASEKVAAKTANLFAGLDLTFHLFHVLDTSDYYTFYGANLVNVDEFETKVFAAAQEQMKNFAEKVKASTQADPKTYIAKGNIEDEVSGYVKKNNIDLIAMPTHGRTGISHVLIGSVTEKVVRSAPCPVLTFKAYEA